MILVAKIIQELFILKIRSIDCFSLILVLVQAEAQFAKDHFKLQNDTNLN